MARDPPLNLITIPTGALATDLAQSNWDSRLRHYLGLERIRADGSKRRMATGSVVLYFDVLEKGLSAGHRGA